MLKAFAACAKKKYDVDVKTSAMPQGTPVAYGQIVEWKGKPQADVFWGGEGTLFDPARPKGLLDKVQLPKAMWDEIPATIGKPVGLPLKDPKGFWVGTTLEPYGIIYQPKLLKRLGVEIKDWDDLLNPKLKGQIAQCTPDRSSSSHASYEVILADLRLGKGLGLADQARGQHGDLHGPLPRRAERGGQGRVRRRRGGPQLHGLRRGPRRLRRECSSTPRTPT